MDRMIRKAKAAEKQALERLDKLAREIQQENAFRPTYEEAYMQALEREPELYALTKRLRLGLAQAQIAPPDVRGEK